MSVQGTRVTIRPYPNRPEYAWWGTQLLLNGIELPEVRNFTLTVPGPDEIPTITAEVNAYGHLDVELEARVTVNVTALPGYTLVVEQRGDRTHYQVRSITEDEHSPD